MFSFFKKIKNRFKSADRLLKEELELESKKIINLAKFFSFLAVRRYVSNDLSKLDKLKASCLFKSRLFFNRSRRLHHFNHFLDYNFASKLTLFIQEVNYNNEINDFSGQLKIFKELNPEYFTEKEYIKLNYIFKVIDEKYPGITYTNLIKSVAYGSDKDVAIIATDTYKKDFRKTSKLNKLESFKVKLIILSISSIIVLYFV